MIGTCIIVATLSKFGNLGRHVPVTNIKAEIENQNDAMPENTASKGCAYVPWSPHWPFRRLVGRTFAPTQLDNVL